MENKNPKQINLLHIGDDTETAFIKKAPKVFKNLTEYFLYSVSAVVQMAFTAAFFGYGFFHFFNSETQTDYSFAAGMFLCGFFSFKILLTMWHRLTNAEINA